MIRHATPDDAAAVRAVYAPYVETGWATFEEAVPSVDEVADRMGSGYPWFVAVEGSEVVGFAYGSRHRERGGYRTSADVSCYVARPGLGLGTALYAALLPAMAARGDLISLYAGIALPNPASVALHERSGFRACGVFPSVGVKHGLRDVGWWYLPVSDV